MAPVTKRSSKTCLVVMRSVAQVRLGQAVFHRACLAVQTDRTRRGRYEALRTSGRSYGRILCGVADQLLGVACMLLQPQPLFDPTTAHQWSRRLEPSHSYKKGPCLRSEMSGRTGASATHPAVDKG
jgi:transposase